MGTESGDDGVEAKQVGAARGLQQDVEKGAARRAVGKGIEEAADLVEVVGTEPSLGERAVVELADGVGRAARLLAGAGERGLALLAAGELALLLDLAIALVESVAQTALAAPSPVLVLGLETQGADVAFEVGAVVGSLDLAADISLAAARHSQVPVLRTLLNESRS